jgi:hypothetical protein
MYKYIDVHIFVFQKSQGEESSLAGMYIYVRAYMHMYMYEYVSA